MKIIMAEKSGDLKSRTTDYGDIVPYTVSPQAGGDVACMYCLDNGRTDRMELNKGLREFADDYASFMAITTEPMQIEVECADEDAESVTAMVFENDKRFTVLIGSV